MVSLEAVALNRANHSLGDKMKYPDTDSVDRNMIRDI